MGEGCRGSGDEMFGDVIMKTLDLVLKRKWYDMIDSHELALGNWVYDGDRTQFPMCVIGLDINDVYLNFESNEGDVWESSYEDLCGIPLTEELLEKMGFYRNKLWWRKQDKGYAVDVSVGLAYV